jgi:ketosteroid isomerase-like protein
MAPSDRRGSPDTKAHPSAMAPDVTAADDRVRIAWRIPTTGEKHMAGNGQNIIELDRQRMQAMASKDVATLNKLLADDLIYCHSSARLDTKQSLIGAMQSGATVYTGVEPSDVKAQDCGDAVVLTGIARINVVSGGKPNAFSVRFTDVYANRGGQWQMVTWQSTRLPE